MPLAAVAEEKILCVHGGIGKALNKVNKYYKLKDLYKLLMKA